MSCFTSTFFFSLSGFSFHGKSRYFKFRDALNHDLWSECSSDFWINECVFDTDLGLKWDWTLKHTENRAPVFSTAEGIQMERPLRAPLFLHCNIQFQLLQRDYCSLKWAFITSLKKRKSF